MYEGCIVADDCKVFYRGDVWITNTDECFAMFSTKYAAVVRLPLSQVIIKLILGPIAVKI